MTELLLMYLIAAFGHLAFMAGAESERKINYTNEDLYYTVLLCMLWPITLSAAFQYSENVHIKSLRKNIAKKIDKLKNKN